MVYGDWKAAPSNRTAQVTPDGRYLAFMSYARLTGYDNRLVGGGICSHSQVVGCFEVFEYDLQTGSLACASCNPSGTRPVGQSNLSLIRPQAGTALAPPFPQPENLLAGGEGRLFFESQDALTPTDTNGNIQDVYEWTPAGVGGCTRARGCVGLISSGQSPNDSMFLNATPSGSDVFFVTRERLVPEDQDDLLDVYDARQSGGFERTAGASCEGEGCRGSLSEARGIFGAPASVTFSGAGNLAPAAAMKPVVKARALTRAQKLAKALKGCRREKSKKKRVECEKQARNKSGVKAKKKAKR